MRFLCLHGMGTNSRIFEAQTAALRYTLGSEHSYEYIDGSVPTEKAPGIESLVSLSSEEFLQYADDSDPKSCLRALLDLDAYIKEEGPFDAVMAFSQGAGLAASLLVYRMQQDPQQARLSPVFRCAVFFSGGIPEDPKGVEAAAAAGTRTAEGEENTTTNAGATPRRLMSFEEDGEIIAIPTAHIWGRNDTVYPTFGPVLSRMCKSSQREVLIHEGAHEILGAKDQSALQKLVTIINRTIARAEMAQ